MVLEKKHREAGVAEGKSVPNNGAGAEPSAYRVLIRIDDRHAEEAVIYMVEKAFGSGVEVSSRPGGKISERVWLELGGSFPREIAEARAEVVRRGAVLGRLPIGILIKKVA